MQRVFVGMLNMSKKKQKRKKKKLSAKEIARRKLQRYAVEAEQAAKKAEGQYGIHAVRKNRETLAEIRTEKV